MFTTRTSPPLIIKSAGETWWRRRTSTNRFI